MTHRFFLKSFEWILFSALIFISCNRSESSDYPFDLDFYCEDYQPLNFLENDKLTGLVPELLEKICNNLDIPFAVSVLPWREAYDQTRKSNSAVLLSTILNSTRKDQFKWAGPIASVDWLLYQSSQSLHSISSLEEAKTAESIGVIQGYSIEQFLLDQGFTNLKYCSNQEDGFEQLLNGEIDFFPASEITAEAVLNTLGKTIYALRKGIPLQTELVYFAFNLSVPDQVVEDFQNGIDALKGSGEFLNMYQKYLNTSKFPETLILYTEQYPPLTYRDNLGEITGFGTDLVQEILRRNQEYHEITLSSWSNGYQLALNHPNICLFTMDRTEIRENLFQWVGPIGTNTTWFYTKKGSAVKIESLDDARSLSAIGTVDSWFSTQYLKELGFTNLVGAGDPGAMTEKLLKGEVEAFVVTDVTFPDILKEMGYTYQEVNPSFALMSSDYYIAFSETTSPTIVNQWQSCLEKMKSDGTYTAIHQKWFPQ